MNSHTHRDNILERRSLQQRPRENRELKSLVLLLPRTLRPREHTFELWPPLQAQLEASSNEAHGRPSEYVGNKRLYHGQPTSAKALDLIHLP